MSPEDLKYAQDQKDGEFALQSEIHTRATWLKVSITAEKKRKEMAAKIGGKGGPLNTGGQGIKKSGKK